MSQPPVYHSGILFGFPENYMIHDILKHESTHYRCPCYSKQIEQKPRQWQPIPLYTIISCCNFHGVYANQNPLDGIPFRLMIDKPSALVKVIPPFSHAASTRRLAENILLNCLMVGVLREDTCWASTITYRATTNNMGKQPDDCFLPLSRQPSSQQPLNWPTLVIETGVSESLPKFREDARWWFENSSGSVRTVIILGIKNASKSIQLEKRQLMYPSLSTSSIINEMLSIPFPVQPPAASQCLYAVQTLTITPTAVSGDVPLVLHFL